MAIKVTMPGAQGVFKCASVPQEDKEKLWVFNNDAEGSIIHRVEIIAYENKTFELEAFCSKSNLETMKQSFQVHLKKPEFVDGEMSRMRLEEVEDVRKLVVWLKDTQGFSTRNDTPTRFSEVVCALGE